MIPFLDLAPQYGAVGAAVEAAALAVLRSGHYVGGPDVAEFEEAFAAFCGVRHAVGVSSGTAALHLALRAADIGAGDEVVTVSSTFVATVAAIGMSGAKPVFVDIDPASWTLDPDRLADAITGKTRAIVPVHLHGRLAEMDRIRAIADRHKLLVIEDAAQAHGAERGGRRAGAFGEMGCFSFYPGKNLGACGEGGLITTDDAALAARVRRLRDWGQSAKYCHDEPGFNERLDALQAAILSAKLPFLEDWTRQRRARAAHYRERLSRFASIGRPAPDEGGDHAWHVFAVRVAERDRVRQRMGEAGIATSVHYPMPVHLQPGRGAAGFARGSLPVTERLAAETLSLPLWPELPLADIDRIIERLGSICEVSHERAA
ncbi:DegT/DnrJ/EryC1/StrS family aminotransferase [Aureimonas sp. AU40]|uniref:DegT/DnrJ/EryC1/StrS family aminotransferase n=1 Tax=Aureimonas sp. AU40 TaxID=1637747 RepID=UPI0007850D33|nr:DegT/DnrJ/EryC1/StrS family aminotransferase [Aureimonas sp. AU40]